MSALDEARARLCEVAVLYCDPNGPYPTLPSVDIWDKTRDARKYDRRSPVVAHPPCHLWVNFAALNFKRYGGEHNRPGNDGGCFKSALNSVRLCGGVLEHPASSNAWGAHALIAPKTIGWNRVTDTEWVCEVWQSAYQHAARKRTWLLYVSPAGFAPYDLNWARRVGTKQVGWFDRIKPTISKKEASRTPKAFAEVLVCLARRSATGR